MGTTEHPYREIWLLDDEIEFAQSIQGACEDVFEIEVYHDPSHMLQAFHKEHQPEVVIIDINLPAQDGFTTITKLKQAGFTGEVIFISGYAEKKHLLQAFEHKAFSVLEKPFTLQQFKKTVSDALLTAAILKNIPSETPSKFKNTPSTTQTRINVAEILTQRNLSDRVFLHDMAPFLMVLNHSLKTLYNVFQKHIPTEETHRLQKNWDRIIESLEKIKDLHANQKEKISRRELSDKQTTAE